MAEDTYDKDTNFDDAVDKAVEVKLDKFAENMNKQMVDNMSKSYANNWLKANSLMMGGNTTGEITEPASQSFLVYKCISVISNNFPQAPFILLDGNNEPALNHPLNELLNKPNDYMSGFDLWSASSAFYTLYGEAYWYMVKSVGQALGTSKIPSEIHTLDPRKIREVVDPNTGMLIGWLYSGGSKGNISLQLDEVIQFKNTNPYNRYRGLSPLDAVGIEIKSDYKASVYQSKFFDNNAIPGLVLQTDKDDTSTISELKKLVRLWEQGHKGVNNAHKTGILKGGMSFETVGLNQQEMDYINSRMFTRGNILSTFGVPEHLAGFIDKGANRALAEEHERNFWQQTLKPQMLRMENKLNYNFINLIDTRIHGVFDLTKIDVLKRSFKEDVETGNILFSMGFSRNEINKRFGLGFPEIDSGDTQYIPMNLIDVDEPDVIPEPVPKPKKESKETTIKDEKSTRARRQRKIFERVQSSNEKILKGKMKKFFISQRVKILKGLFKKEKEFSTSEIIDRINIFEKETERMIVQITPIFQNTIKDAGNMASSFINSTIEYEIDKEILFNRVNKLKDINQTVFSQLKTEIGVGINAGETLDDISKRIKKVYKFADNRSKTIARTETANLINEASLKVYQTQGVKYKEWVTVGDENVRDSCMMAASQGPIKVGKTFANGLEYPQEVNCRCCTVPIIQ